MKIVGATAYLVDGTQMVSVKRYEDEVKNYRESKVLWHERVRDRGYYSDPPTAHECPSLDYTYFR